MDRLSQKIAYIRGLADGLQIEESSKEGIVLSHIVDALEDIVDVLDETVEDQLDLDEYVSLIDEDLTDLEDEFYGYDDCCDECHDGCCDFDDEIEFLDDCCGDEDCCCGFEEFDEEEF